MDAIYVLLASVCRIIMFHFFCSFYAEFHKFLFAA